MGGCLENADLGLNCVIHFSRVKNEYIIFFIENKNKDERNNGKIVSLSRIIIEKRPELPGQFNDQCKFCLGNSGTAGTSLGEV